MGLMVGDMFFKLVVGVGVLGILIFVHELGHFLLAKMCRVGVLEFSIGFGKKIWSKRIGETRYSLGLIPLGGYVRMVGDDPYAIKAQEQKSESEDDGDSEEELAGMGFQSIDEDHPAVRALMADKSRWFLNKSLLARSLIVIAGPGFNILFAWIMAAFFFMHYGTEEIVNKPIIGEVQENMPAKAAGLKDGDTVLAIDGEKIESWETLARTVQASEGRPLTFKINRTAENGAVEEQEIKIAGEQDSEDSADLSLVITGERIRAYRIGIKPTTTPKYYSPGEAMYVGAQYVYLVGEISVKSLVYLVTAQISPKNLGGPISIAKHAGDSAEQGADGLIRFIIFLSVSLAVLNLLPIPVLDGGHLLFFLLEAISRGPIKLEVQQLANQVGMLLLILLMLFAIGMDLLRVTGILTFAS